MLFNLLLWLIFLSAALATGALIAPSEDEIVLRKRIREVAVPGADPRTAREEELARPFEQRVVQPILQRLSGAALRYTPQGLQARLAERLTEAGRPANAGSLMLKKGFGAAGVLVLYFWLLHPTVSEGALGEAGALLVGFATGYLGFLVPELLLGQKVKQRRQTVEKALPEMLDLLCVSVEAGLGLDGAVQRVAEKFTGPLAEEFRHYLKEVKIGKSREEALRTMTERVKVPDLQVFVAAVIQADKLGVSTAKVLRVQADQLRKKRRQRAEEQAMKIPVKMLFPLVFFIFPALFVVLLGPAVLQLVETFSKM